MVKVRICKGMSCSMSGGGTPIVTAIEKALTDVGILDQVEIWTAHCLGECESGPCVRVDGERFYGIHPEDAKWFVQQEILPRIK